MLDLIEHSLADLDLTRREAVANADWAVVWAVVLMATNLVKTGLSAADPRAAAGFAAIDDSVAQFDEIRVKLGHPALASRADALANMEPAYREGAGFLASVRTARSVLQGFKVRCPPKVDVLLNIALEMSEDTLLAMNAAALGQHMHQQVSFQMQHMVQLLRRHRGRLRRLDEELVQWLEAAGRHARTA